MRRLALLFVMAALLLGAPQQARAQSGSVTLTEVGVEAEFGVGVTFRARVQSPVLGGSLYFRDDFDGITRVQPLQLEPDGLAWSRYDVTQNVLRPFTTLTYWFEFTLQGGQTARSAEYQARYLDNRFPWQEASNGLLRVHWYEGDPAFGAALLDAASRGMNQAATLVSSANLAPVDVYVYATAPDLQGALFLGGETWTGGHANPKLNVVMAVVAPGPTQGIEMETLLPHELAHVLLYRSVGEGYARLPVWLGEGVASLAELYPNPDYALALETASREGRLLPMEDLCASFPPDAASAFLAYAQSQSFVRYLRDTYGSPALFALTAAYADGLGCNQGAVRALGVPLAQLEARWRETALGENAAGVFLRNMLPYLALLGLLLFLPLIGVLQRRPKNESGN
ncbi:MAG: peptidase MA family metallohydrolase [Chloroflexota bacterium]